MSFHAVASVDMAIAKFFKPCWLMKKKPINHMHSEEEVGISYPFIKIHQHLQANRLCLAASTLGKSLDISSLNWQKCDEALLGGLDPREQQLVTKFRERLACRETASEKVVQPVVLPRPAVQRTYSRRGRGQVTKFCNDSDNCPNHIELKSKQSVIFFDL